MESMDLAIYPQCVYYGLLFVPSAVLQNVRNPSLPCTAVRERAEQLPDPPPPSELRNFLRSATLTSTNDDDDDTT